MTIDSNNLMEDIKESRPNLKDNTIKQYMTNLKKLKSLFDTDNYNFLDKPDDVMDKISHLHYTSQRNHLNAIIVLLMALNSKEEYDKLIETYSNKRDELNDKYSEDQKSGVISDKQSKNLSTTDEIYEMINKMANELKPIKKKDNLSSKELALLQVFTLFNIYVRLPMRNDVAGMESINKRVYNKLTEEDKKSKNYLVLEKNNMYFILNKYKTSKKYEELKIDIPKDLKKLLRFFLKVNGMGVLFKSSTGNPLTRNALSQLLIKTSQKYMGKSISTTLLRKAYMSSKYADVKEEMENDSKILGHDVATTGMNVYVKKAHLEE